MSYITLTSASTEKMYLKLLSRFKTCTLEYQNFASNDIE